jgi:hypothetical protein
VVRDFRAQRGARGFLLTTLGSADLGLSPQRARLAIGLIAVGAFVLRLLPLLLPGGPLAYVVNYDEGVYFSASALLTRGTLPYRDFLFVHPPGLLVFLAPISSWATSGHVAAAFAATRYLATLVGAGNAALAGAIALRAFGPLGGVSAALLYATFTEAVREERGPFLEPVLNLACLAMAWVWLRAGSRRRQFAAGLLGGLALSVKTWGAIWLVAALATSPRGRRLATGIAFLAGVAAALALLVLPFALAAPRDFLEQVVGFQLLRGPQGIREVLPRLVDMNRRHPLTSLLALAGFALVVASLRKGQSTNNSAGRFFALVLALTVASFLAAPVYFHRYASFLAPSAAVLGGLAVAWIHERTRARARWAALAPAMLFLAVGSSAAYDLLTTRRFRAPQQLALAAVIRETVPSDACLFALEPGWMVIADRLPDARGGILDSWASIQTPQLLATLGEDRSPEAVRAARDAARLERRRFLESCRFFVTGDWHLDEETNAWLERRWIKRHPPAGERGLDLWEQRP